MGRSPMGAPQTGAGVGAGAQPPASGTGMAGSQLSERRRSAMAGGMPTGAAASAPARDNKDRDRKKKPSGPPSAFAEELAKAL